MTILVSNTFLDDYYTLFGRIRRSIVFHFLKIGVDNFCYFE